MSASAPLSAFPKAPSPSVITSFFSRLEKTCSEFDDQVRALELEQRRVGNKVDASEIGVAAEAAEEIFNEISLMNKSVGEIHKVAKQEVTTMENFLGDAMQQLGEMSQIVRNYEAWAALYGYVPQFNLELDLEDALRTKKAEAVSPGQEKQTVKDNAPSLLEFGLSKAALNKMGYKFKEDFQPSNLDLAEYSSNETDFGGSIISSNTLEDSVFGNEDDETPPVSILKKIPFEVSVSHSMCEFLPETSRIEISPGLFVRKPKPMSNKFTTPASIVQQRSIGKKVAAQASVEDCSLETTPQAPELKTVNLRKLLEDAKAQTNAGQSCDKSVRRGPSPQHPSRKFLTPVKSNLENIYPRKTEEDLPPVLPTLSSKKLRKLVSSAIKSRHDASSIVKDEEDSPGPPQPPQLSRSTLAMLKEKM